MAVKKLLSFKRSSNNNQPEQPDDLSSTHSSTSSSTRGGNYSSSNANHHHGSNITTTSNFNNINSSFADNSSSAVSKSDFKSFQYSFKSNSLFSKSAHTTSTSATSRNSELSTKNNGTGGDRGITNIGRPLRVLDEEELDEKDEDNVNAKSGGGVGGADSASVVVDLANVLNKVDKELKSLAMELNNIILQINQSMLNLTKSSIKVDELIKQVIKNLQNKQLTSHIPQRYITTLNNQSFRKIVKVILYLIDNLLNDEVYTNSRVLILKSFNDLLVVLRLIPCDDANDLINYNSMLQPKLFSIGSTEQPFPNENKIETITNSFLSRENMILDQEGSFIAPVLRGFYNENISCITFMFGFPELTKEHKQIINVFYSLIDDFHFMYQKNHITLAKTDFRAPFRIPTNWNEPPISMSISSENSTNLSGTLGGYIFPKIDKTIKNKNLLKYENSVFGMTCAHVVLQDNISNEAEYPYVSCPSPVLINLYKRALNNEKFKYKQETEEFNAYNNVINQIDQIFPQKELKLSNQQIIKRNIASTQFGQIIWGERIINSGVGKLSDMAIIKMSSNLKCLNYLGDDINFNEYDPSLMFTNLYLKKVVDISNLKKNSRGLTNGGGLEVFKYGSTTKYTKGFLNGVKLIHWSDGKLQTSEFVIKSNDSKNTSFASGGDSGSWILSKLQDISKYENNFVNTILNQQRVETGLGVIGMLHSYDGEFKQFGLFTPMTDILDRLKDVTGLSWGVIGCDEDEGNDEDALSDIETSHKTFSDQDDDSVESSSEEVE